VNGPSSVWFDRGSGLTRSKLSFVDDEAVRRLAQRLAAACGRRLDDAHPWVDATLPDGTRVHAVLPPVSSPGVCLSLRTFRRTAFRLEDLVTTGSIAPAGAELLTEMMAARLAFLVTGGTGSGKTTLLSTLLGLAHPGERLVMVEDAPELRPSHPHVVRLTARPPNAEGAGAVSLRDLVRQAMRMRPDRLVVGECRGPEVVELLAALNTGHEGGAGTVHANSPGDVLARLEALAATGGLSASATRSQVRAAVQCVVHMARGPQGRRMTEICVGEPAQAGFDLISVWHHRTGPGPGADLFATLVADRGVSQFPLRGNCS
jgi:pilus assembly protein CpaF